MMTTLESATGRGVWRNQIRQFEIGAAARVHNTPAAVVSHQFGDVEGGVTARAADRRQMARPPPPLFLPVRPRPTKPGALKPAWRSRSSSSGNCTTSNQRVRRHINGRFAVAEWLTQIHADLLIRISYRNIPGALAGVHVFQHCGTCRQ